RDRPGGARFRHHPDAPARTDQRLVGGPHPATRRTRPRPAHPGRHPPGPPRPPGGRVRPVHDRHDRDDPPALAPGDRGVNRVSPPPPPRPPALPAAVANPRTAEQERREMVWGKRPTVLERRGSGSKQEVACCIVPGQRVCSPRTWGWSQGPARWGRPRRLLPAHAGRGPGGGRRRAARWPAPRARGDGPTAVWRAAVAVDCSPRTWGWSRLTWPR